MKTDAPALTRTLAQTDPDEIVKSFAAAQLDLLDRTPAATQPAGGEPPAADPAP